MLKEQVLGILRHILTSAGGAAVASGVVTQDQATSIIGGVVALVGVAWSIYSNRRG